MLYISGEEAVDQVRLRARRLGLARRPLELAAAINVRDIAADAGGRADLALVVIDSIQTMWLDTIESAPGTVAQVRASGFELIRLAKSARLRAVLVGHVTKEGALAGPRVLEHMVDAVLYFEGDRGHQFRILRAAKNRFGATDEIGVFEMTERGLAEVPNPSALFLAERRGNIAGSAVFAGLEGTRPVLLEVQALLAPNAGGVAAARGGRLGRRPAVHAAGGAGGALRPAAAGIGRLPQRRRRPAHQRAGRRPRRGRRARLGRDRPAHQRRLVYFGEVGLSGEVRQVAQAEARLKEAQKLGFERAFLPRRVARGRNRLVAPDGVRLEEIGHLSDLTASFTPEEG